MIYFLVNNDYQFSDVELHLSEFSKGECSLIQVPCRLTPLTEHPRFTSVYTFPSCIRIKYFFLDIFFIKNLKRRVSKALSPGPDDVLFVYTEVEYLNQHIITIFHKAGAKIFLIENGMATCLVFNMKSARLPLRLKLKLVWIKYILGFATTGLIYDKRSS